MKAFFIIGTDTGVGKTTVACAISAYCSLKKNLNVGVMKPFEAGISLHGKDLLPLDAILLREASGSQDGLAVINPYSFEAPLAPETAAEKEHVHVDMEHLDRIYKGLLKAHDILFVEGVGGILVPIKKDFFFSDLIRRWNAAVIVVSRLGLGTINHTLLTCWLLHQQGISIAGVILNDVDGTQDAATRSNPEMLSRYLEAPLLGIYPHQAGASVRDRRVLAEIAEKHLDMTPILK